MAKKPLSKNKTQEVKPEVSNVRRPVEQKSNFDLPSWAVYVLIFVFACALYSNTLWNKYAMDDKIVLTDNQFTKKGSSGIKDIMTHDVYEGFLGENAAKYLSGGRYRPLSLVTMAAEYELMRKARGDNRGELNAKNIIIGEKDPYLSPRLSHVVNLILFAFTAVTLCYFLLLIFPIGKAPFYFSMPFLATILYVAHPIHTEAVANIKGRDEIMTLLFSLLALIGAVQYVRTQKLIYLLAGMVMYFVALLSKENAITFFAIVPLTYYFFTNARLKDYLLSLGLYVVPVVVFLLLRSTYTQTTIGEASPEILNNPFLLATGTQKFATIIYTFLLYFKLLIFPHPLSHDYYYNQIPYVDVSDISFILSFLVSGALIVYALINLKKKSVYSYAILFYFITFSIVSNLFFTVGTTMNERFVYISSLGFCIALAYALIQLKDRLKLSPSSFGVVLALILSFYSFKTVNRNSDWVNDTSLLKNDVRWSPNSAKIRASLSNELIMESDELKDTVAKMRLLDSAVTHAREALKIYPTYIIAWVDLANALYRENSRPEEVIPIYKKALDLKPGGYYDANYALAVVYNNANMGAPAKENLLTAIRLRPNQGECYYLLAQVCARINQADSVEYWLKKGQEFRPLIAKDYYQVGMGFGMGANNLDKAIEYLNKAIQLDPQSDFFYYDLSVAYIFSGRYQDAIETNEKLIKLNPGYADAYKNMAVAYAKLGDTTTANQFRQKYAEVVRVNGK